MLPQQDHAAEGSASVIPAPRLSRVMWKSVDDGEFSKNGGSKAALVDPGGVSARMAPAYSMGSDATAPDASSAAGNSGTYVRSRAASEAKKLGANVSAEAVREVADGISSLERQIWKVEGKLEDVQDALASGGAYRGRQGGALVALEETLVRKEEHLRDKEKQLRDEKSVLLRARDDPGQLGVPEAHKRVSFLMSSAFVDDPAGELREQQRLAKLTQVIKRRSMSASDSGDYAGFAAGTEDTVITIHKIEEDSRLLVRIGAFQLPILVSTLLSGFTLVLFDVAETALAQRLAIVSFGLETSASTVLCLIAYRGQQLYSHATDITPLARKFLHRMLPITIFALVAFALGVILFVFAFVVEASDSLGSSWMTIIALAFFPTVIAGVLFAASTVQVRRHSIPPGPE